MKITYRPEIDGLRAIAVVAVLLYHLNIKGFFSGGFLGVDVFFVISGYLITSIMVKELIKTGSFDFKNFYNRRIRRLIPVLLVVVFCASIAGWQLLYPTQFIDFSKSILSSLFFYSNFYWDSTLQEYGAESGLIKPLLHTWTLSLEEQFYLVFPCIFILLFKFIRDKALWVLGAIFLLSLTYAQYKTPIDFSSSFYLLPTRFWELLAGSMLAIYNADYKRPTFEGNSKLLSIIPIVGIIMIVGSFFIFNHDFRHPGLITLIPILGTILLIQFPLKENWLIKLLSHKVSTTIGLYSYSMYLWHYPVYAYGRIVHYDVGIWDYVLWISLTVLLSWLSYNYVEQPMRSSKKLSKAKFYKIIAPVTIITVAFSFFCIFNLGLPQRFSKLQSQYGNIEIDNKVLQNESRTILNSAEYEEYINTITHDNNHILIVGDSHGRDLFNAFYLNKDEYPNCKFEYFTHLGEKIKNKELLQSDSFQDADVIIYSFRYTRKQYLFKMLPRLIKETKKHGKKIILSGPNIEFPGIDGMQLFDYYAQNISKSTEQFDHKKVNAYFFSNRYKIIKGINNRIREIAQKHHVKYLDKEEIVCSEQVCTGITLAGKKSYYDRSHWTLDGARYFGQQIVNQGWVDKLNEE